MTTSQCALFFDVCRLCLANKGVSEICKEADLPRKVALCTGVQVHTSDNLPQKICAQCLDVVCKAVDLRKLAKMNEYNLRSLFDDPVETVKLETLSSDDEKSHDESTRECQYQPKDDGPQIKIRNDLFSNSSFQVKVEKDNTCENKLTDKDDTMDSSEFIPDSDSQISSLRRENSASPKCKKKRRELAKCLIKEEFECDVCQKTYETPKKLYLHQRVHNKKIVCPLDVCNKSFATRGDLRKHIRSHTGERPFECDECGKKFTQRGTLKVHKNTIHSDWVFL